MQRRGFTRRDVLKFGAAGAVAATLAACASTPEKTAGKVVVIGGGFGGASAAKYLRLWSQGQIDVTLVEPDRQFVSCPISNLVLAGSRTMADGGVVLIGVPPAPYRCPPGPYERACQIAAYLKARKPRSKLIVLDANPAVTSKGPLFTRVWKEDYASILEYLGERSGAVEQRASNDPRRSVQTNPSAAAADALVTHSRAAKGNE